MEKAMIRGQTAISPIVRNSKNVVIRGLGFMIFIVGAVFILSSYLGIPIITGHAIAGSMTSTASLAGIILEVIGIVLMGIKTGSREFSNKEACIKK